jgi:hypothetical protein
MERSLAQLQAIEDKADCSPESAWLSTSCVYDFIKKARSRFHGFLVNEYERPKATRQI